MCIFSEMFVVEAVEGGLRSFPTLYIAKLIAKYLKQQQFANIFFVNCFNIFDFLHVAIFDKRIIFSTFIHYITKMKRYPNQDYHFKKSDFKFIPIFENLGLSLKNYFWT